MRTYEKILLNRLRHKDNLQLRGGSSRSSRHLALQNIVGNPVHIAQFNIHFLIYYYSTAAAGFIAPAALPANLQTSNKAVIFGNADFAGSFAKAKTFIPENVWIDRNIVGIWNRDIDGSSIIAAVQAVAVYMKDGDLLFMDYSTIGTNYYRFTIIRCPQVSYGTLLDAVGSDTFIINMLRYKVDPTQLDQFNNQIIIGKQSIFGKTKDDKIDPGTYVTSKTYNQNIADIPLHLGIDKHVFLATYINYDIERMSWIITVQNVHKIRPQIFNY